MTKDTSALRIPNTGVCHHCQKVVRKSSLNFFEKLEKMAHLFSICMSLLSHINWEAIDDGREGGEDSYLLHI